VIPPFWLASEALAPQKPPHAHVLRAAKLLRRQVAATNATAETSAAATAGPRAFFWMWGQSDTECQRLETLHSARLLRKYSTRDH